MGLAMISIAIVSKRVRLEVLGFDLRDFPPARIPDLPANTRQYPGATGDRPENNHTRLTSKHTETR
jgi:hypothetical protein